MALDYLTSPWKIENSCVQYKDIHQQHQDWFGPLTIKTHKQSSFRVPEYPFNILLCCCYLRFVLLCNDWLVLGGDWSWSWGSCLVASSHQMQLPSKIWQQGGKKARLLRDSNTAGIHKTTELEMFKIADNVLLCNDCLVWGGDWSRSWGSPLVKSSHQTQLPSNIWYLTTRLKRDSIRIALHQTIETARQQRSRAPTKRNFPVCLVYISSFFSTRLNYTGAFRTTAIH